MNSPGVCRGLATLDAVAEGAASEIHASLGRPVVVMLAQGDDLSLTAAWPPEDTLDAAAMTAARWAYSHVEPAGADTGTLPIIPWYFVPLRIGDKTLGVIGVAKEKDAPRIDSEARALLDTLVEQTAAALERASLAREMVSAKTATETERVRNTLLASVSHDFRTPLSSILGSATSLIDYGDKLDAAAKKDLLGQIKQEAEDLDEMVRNLLAITRIDAGALELRRDWIDLREVAERVVSAARRHGARQHIDVRLPADLPLVRADATLAEQAIGNVVANAVVHTPPGTHVVLEAEVAAEAVALRVTDDGPGIAADKLPVIFDKFVKGAEPAGPRADGGQGTGLGLAIAKGIMEAHGGTISAESPVANGRGARFIMTFPRDRERRHDRQNPRPGHRRRGGDPAVPQTRAGSQQLRDGERRHGGRGHQAHRRRDARYRAARPRPAGWRRQGRDQTRPRMVRFADRRACRRASVKPRRSRRSISAPTTTSTNPSMSANCWRACARRCATACSARPKFPCLRVGNLEVDAVRHRATRAGAELKLTPKEFELLSFLAKHAGRVVTHKQILTAVWGPAHTEDTQYLRVYIGQLRQKIEEHPDDPRIVLTEPGIGYRIAEV